MGVKAFNVADLGKVGLLDPTKMGYRDSLEIIKDESFKIQKSFVKIGWYLKHIKDDELYRVDGYDNIYDCAADQLGYAQSTVSRLINICEKFSKDHNSPELDEKYSGFDKSQMIEMLPMSSEQLEKVTPDMTVKQIREVKNELIPIQEETKQEDTDIPGQTSIEKDFPEYMPEDHSVSTEQNDNDQKYTTSHKQKAKDLSEEENIIKNMNKELFKEDCQFLNLDLAESTSGSDEPVPCCKSCQINATCFFCCDKAKKLCHISEQESEEETKSLQKSETVVDGECRSISTEVILENEDEESLREEIEELADGVKEVFWGWEGQPIPKGEVEAAKKNVIKLSFAIEKLLTFL